MDFGILYQANPDMLPHEFARTVEEHGIESVWYPEHTHIPVSHEIPYPGYPGGELSPIYRQFMDPFVSMSAAAVSTVKVRIGTAICLMAQRDPITTAKALASIDQLSGGRAILGAAPGWNVQEMLDHGIDPARRFGILRENVLAMKQIWTHEEASFEGRYVNFPPMWQEPKPVQSPHLPVLIGGDGPKAPDRALEYGDGWIMLYRLHDDDDLLARVRDFHARAQEAGRAPLAVTLVGAPMDLDVLARFDEAGVGRAVITIRPGPFDPPDLGRLESVAEFQRALGR